MANKALAVLVVCAFSGVGALGDDFLTLASEEPHSLRSPRFYVGFAVYASTAVRLGGLVDGH